jgi:hypothetical protein
VTVNSGVLSAPAQPGANPEVMLRGHLHCPRHFLRVESMNEDRQVTKAALLSQIHQSWDDLHSTLGSLSKEQMTKVLDAHGWSVKDHLTHLAAWGQSAAYFLQGKPRHEGLGIDKALYDRGDFDQMNAAIQERYRGITLAQATAMLTDIHEQMLDLIGELPDSDLSQPLEKFHPETLMGDPRQVFDIVYDNSAGHYAEHLVWIRALVAEGQ